MTTRLCLSLLAAVSSTAVASVSLGDSTVSPTVTRDLPDIRLDGATFVDAIDFLADATGANIHVDWQALETIGITKDSLVSCKLRHVTLRKALALLINSVGKGDQLTYFVDEGVIEITSRVEADQKLYTATYPVDDILLDVPDFKGPDFNLSSGSSGGGGKGSGVGIFDLGKSDDGEKAKTKAERAEDLISVIKETLRPEVWRDNGGTATIRYFNGNLIVTAPRSIHESLGGSFGR